MQFSCDSCKAQLQIADEKVRGKRLIVRCRRCGAKIAIADPALPRRSSPRVVTPATGPAAVPAPIATPAPQPAVSAQPAPAQPRSDTDITRSMESDVLERALQASAAEVLSQNGAPRYEARAAPPADGAIWFAMLHGKQTGPLTRAELDSRVEEGEVGPRTYLWREGMDSWQRAKDVPDLAAMFPAVPTPSAPPKVATPTPRSQPPARAAAEPARSEPAATQPERSEAPAAEAAGSTEPPRPEAAAPQQRPVSGDTAGATERAQSEEIARQLFASGEHSISQKNAMDLARWASDEMRSHKEPGGPGIAPPVIHPAPMFASTAPVERSKAGIYGFVALAVIAIGALAVWVLIGSAPEHPEEAQKPAQQQAQPAPPAPTPPAPSSPPQQPAPAPATPQAQPQPKPVEVTPAPPPAGLTGEQLSRKLDEQKHALQKCLDEARRREPTLRLGTIHIAATVAPNGRVTAAKIDQKTVDESQLGACLKTATRKIVFPSFSGQPFDLDIPIVVSGGR